MKILIAEDDDAVRAVLVRLLDRLGHDVASFTNGALLADALQAGVEADLVLTDLAMPIGDGTVVIRAARKHLPDVPIVVVSGAGNTEHILTALREGAHHFLPKPAKDSELLSLLRRIDEERTVQRDKVRVWNSFVRCDVALRVPADMGVAKATAALLGKHSRSFLEEVECRGLQTAAHELLLNSIEHGCLEITRDEKLAALSDRRYEELLAARRADPRLGGRVVMARMIGDLDAGVTITLTDPGPGFDPDSLPDPSEAGNLFLESGRGIIMARLHVGELRYENGGRTVVLHTHGKLPPLG